MKANLPSAGTPCPACATTAQRPCSLDKWGVLWRHCQVCDVMHCDPLRGPGAEWYSEAYQDRNHVPIDRLRWRHFQFLRDLPAAGRDLLEVGCGTGYFLAEAARHGYRVTGIDFDPEAIANGRAWFGLDDLRCGHAPQVLAGRSFDVVVLFEVLEHTDHPGRFFDEAASLVRRGGFMALSMPHRDRWPDFMGRIDGPPIHLTRWSIKAIRGLVERAGFEVVRTQTGESKFEAFLSDRIRFGIVTGLVRKARRETRPGDGRLRAASVLSVLKASALRFCALPVAAALKALGSPGDSIYMLARKR